MEKVYCKAGTVELSEKEAFEIWENNKYIVTSYGIFQPNYSMAQCRVYFTKISDIKGIAKRGRFHIMSGKEINHILKYDYLL